MKIGPPSETMDLGHLTCYIGVSQWKEIGKFGQPIHHRKYGSKPTRQKQPLNKVNGNIQPWKMRDWQRLQLPYLMNGLIFIGLIDHIFLDKLLNVIVHPFLETV